MTREIFEDQISEQEISELDEEINFEDVDKKSISDSDNSTKQLHHLVDSISVRDRLAETVQILTNFSASTHKHPRSHFISLLKQDTCSIYGYSEYLIDVLINMFTPSELVDFLDSNENSRLPTIRVNTLKTKKRELVQFLTNRGVTVEALASKWSPISLTVTDAGKIPMGATPEYLAGYYILQSVSSLLPVMALAPKHGERILDMAAAPGGKTTHIAAEMQNTGCLFANDPNKERCRSLIANLHRMGIRNTVVCCLDGRKFPSFLTGFDRVLLDAPCSGTGVISKDPSVKTSKTENDFKLLTHLQKELILAAIDCTEPNPKHPLIKANIEDGKDESYDGGIIVYSTCSITVEENEAVVDYALKMRPNVRLLDTGLPSTIGTPGFINFRGNRFHPSVTLTRRFYPHKDEMDGFFVAKFLKVSSKYPETTRQNELIGPLSKRKKNDSSKN